MNEDWRNEPGVQDTSYQDFVAPLLAGLGGVPRIAGALASKAPAIASGLGAGAAAASDDVSSSEEDAIRFINRFADAAQKIGDWPRTFQYKALRTALSEGTISPDEVFGRLLQLNANPGGN